MPYVTLRLELNLFYFFRNLMLNINSLSAVQIACCYGNLKTEEFSFFSPNVRKCKWLNSLNNCRFHKEIILVHFKQLSFDTLQTTIFWYTSNNYLVLHFKQLSFGTLQTNIFWHTSNNYLLAHFKQLYFGTLQITIFWYTSNNYLLAHFKQLSFGTLQTTIFSYSLNLIHRG